MGGPRCSPGDGQALGPALREAGSPIRNPVPGRPSITPLPPPAPPTPLPAPAPPPTNREGKFPGTRSQLQALGWLPDAEAGRGAGARVGRQPEGAQDEARRGGWAAAAVSSVPAHRAAITARRRLPAGRRHRRDAGGGPAWGRGQALTCRRGDTAALRDGTGQCGAERGEG